MLMLHAMLMLHTAVLLPMAAPMDQRRRASRHDGYAHF
jgi:hypothetical protein